MSLLEVRNLKTQFHTEEGRFNAVDGVSFHVDAGRTLGIVGESGCGKSVTSLSLMRLIQSPGKIIEGEILFDQKKILSLSDSEMRKIRGNEMAMIFQEPMTSLNPVFTVGDQIEEVIAVHNPDLKREKLKARAIEMLRKVGIPLPEQRYGEYPHQLSGGMRQRVMIAMAMSCNPRLLIADEPTTALDVTIQAQILDLMRKMQNEFQAGMILITHDLGVVAEMCDDVLVMYAGRVIESGNVYDIFERPQHPYTRGLLDSIPHFESSERLDRLKTIPGLVPSLTNLPQGCRFADRCFKVSSKCREAMPELQKSNHTQSRADHSVACYFPLKTGERA